MDPTPEQRLAGAVFQQALTDACKGRGALRRQAEGWLLHGDGEVLFWCHLAGLDVARVRVGVQRALEQRRGDVR